MISVDGLDEIPKEISNQQDFRQMIIAQCLDLQSQCRPQFEQHQRWEKELQSVRERRVVVWGE